MSKKLNVLLVEDCEDDAILLRRELVKGGYEAIVSRVDNAADLRAAMAEQAWDVVISDYNLPQFDALAALQVVKEKGIDIPFIIVSGKIGEDLAVAAMKAGAHDYLMKGNLARLVPAIERELREAVGREARRKVEEAIRQGKMEWQAAFDAVSDLIILTDCEGNIIRSNRRVPLYFNRGYDEIIGGNLVRLFHGEDSPDQEAFTFPQSVAQQPQEEEEKDIFFPVLSGWFNVSSYPILSAEGKTHGVIHIIKDITKRKNMEEEKRIRERELLTLYAIAFRLNSKRGLAKILEDLLFQLHNMLKIEFSCIHLVEEGVLNLKASLGLNKDVEQALHHMPEGSRWVKQIMAGKAFSADSLHEDFPPPVVEAATAMGMGSWCAVPLKIGAEVIGALMVAHRSQKSFSDREIFLLASIANQVAVLIDNHMLYEQMKQKAAELERSRHELKANLKEIKKANEELGRLNAAKTTFMGMASHELKTPLTSILGGLQFLYQYGDLKMSEEQRTIFSSVYEGVVELKKLVDDLLSISRIEAGGVVLDKRPHQLMALCREVKETFRLALSKRNISITIAGDEVPVPADESFFRLVIRNLMENAIKFTPDGGWVTVAGKILEASELRQNHPIGAFYPDFPQNVSADRYYSIEVIDSGVGIPPHERVRVFEKFYGVGDIAYHSSGKTEFMSKGTGLGLSIVKGIIDAHGGLVWNAAAPGGQGTIFSVVYPLDGAPLNEA